MKIPKEVIKEYIKSENFNFLFSVFSGTIVTDIFMLPTAYTEAVSVMKINEIYISL